MKKIFLTILILLSVSPIPFAQSQYLQKGEKAVSAGLGFQINEIPDSNLGFIYLSYGADGRADVGVQLGKGRDLTAIAPFLDLFLIKAKKNKSPFSLGLSLKAENYRGYGSSKTSHSVGGFLSLGDATSRNSGLIPFFTVYRTSLDNINATTTGLGFTLFNKKKNIGSVDLGYYRTEGKYTIVISIGSTALRE